MSRDQLVITDLPGVMISGNGQAKTVVEAGTTSSLYPFRVLQIDDGSPVQLSNMTIMHGSSTSPEDGDGGGIEVLSGSLTMRNSTVTANLAQGQGGGIYEAGLNSIGGSSGTESQAYLKNVTITDNAAFGGGGGLDVEGQAVIEGGSVAGNSIRSARFPGPDGAGIRLGDDGNLLSEPSRGRPQRGGKQRCGRGRRKFQRWLAALVRRCDRRAVIGGQELRQLWGRP